MVKWEEIMKNTIHLLIIRCMLFVALSCASLADACPTCYGKLQKNSPAFFADEFEKAEEASNRESDFEQIEMDTEDNHA